MDLVFVNCFGLSLESREIETVVLNKEVGVKSVQRRGFFRILGTSCRSANSASN